MRGFSVACLSKCRSQWINYARGCCRSQSTSYSPSQAHTSIRHFSASSGVRWNDGEANDTTEKCVRTSGDARTHDRPAQTTSSLDCSSDINSAGSAQSRRPAHYTQRHRRKSSAAYASRRTKSSTFDKYAAGETDELHHSTGALRKSSSMRYGRVAQRKHALVQKHSQHRKEYHDAEHQQQQQQQQQQVPRSLDIAAVRRHIDVERFFPAAMRHIKGPLQSDHANDVAMERRWHDHTHVYDVDGIAKHPSPPGLTGEVHTLSSSSLSGGIRIRGGLNRAGMPTEAYDNGTSVYYASQDDREQKRPSSLLGVVALPTTAESDSPDILQLTGGSPQLDGLALASESNQAPADQTIEDVGTGDMHRPATADGGGGAFGDTPVQLTDMLRERLMELKAEKLRSDREETFMPRRLRLKSDAELRREQQQRQRQQENKPAHLYTSNNGIHTKTLNRASDGLCRTSEHRTSRSHEIGATLAHWPGDTDTVAQQDSGALDSATEEDEVECRQMQPILQDGVHPARARRAVELLYQSRGDLPGASSSLPSFSSLQPPQQQEEARTDSRVGPAATSHATSPEDGFMMHEVDQVLGVSSQHHTRDNYGDDAHAATARSSNEEGVYLLRLLARAGLCSRREAAAVVASGQVRVNRTVERNPFRRIRPDEDVHVTGHASRLRVSPPRLWMYHKPSHVLVSRSDAAGRALFTRHARLLGIDHLIPVGSLPMRAHGVLLLTNDGELASFLESPETAVQRTYLLRVRPAIGPVLAHKLNTQGVQLNEPQQHHQQQRRQQRYTDAEFIVNPSAKSRFSLKVKMRGEGMLVSHLLQHIGRTIERGGRISFGPFALGGLAVGSVREVTVPPFYSAHVGAVWKPFIERDWPYFRRQRVARLRRLSRFRELTPKEVEELEGFTYDELRDAIGLDSRELAHAAAQYAEQRSKRPHLADAAECLREDMDTRQSDVSWGRECGVVDTYRHANDSHAEDICLNTSLPDDALVEDVTAMSHVYDSEHEVM